MSESVSMTIRAGVAAEHGFSLVAGEELRKYQFDVVVIDEGHEGIILVHGEDSLPHEVDETSLIGDVVHGGVDGDDDFAHLGAGGVKSALDLEIANATFLGVGTEDIVVLVHEAIELMLEVLNVGSEVGDLELKVGRIYWHDFVTLWGLSDWAPLSSLVAGVFWGRFVEETVSCFTDGVTHGSFGPGDLRFAGTILDQL